MFFSSPVMMDICVHVVHAKHPFSASQQPTEAPAIPAPMMSKFVRIGVGGRSEWCLCRCGSDTLPSLPLQLPNLGTQKVGGNRAAPP